MKYLSLLLFISLMASSCEDDLPVFDNTLQLDGSNSTSPILNAATYETAAYFSASIMEDKVDRKLREIEFYLYNEPAALEVVIYGEGSISRPGNELYSAAVTNLRENKWNTHVLPQSLTLDGNPIWISVRFTVDVAEQTIGCDAGPNVNGGDMFLNSQGWSTFGSFAGENINWNIRADLEPM